jgi:hypothetical protein
MSNKPFGYPQTTYEIELYKDYGDGHWAQARYLVRGNDSYWCNTIDEVLQAIKQTLIEKDQA